MFHIPLGLYGSFGGEYSVLQYLKWFNAEGMVHCYLSRDDSVPGAAGKVNIQYFFELWLNARWIFSISLGLSDLLPVEYAGLSVGLWPTDSGIF